MIIYILIITELLLTISTIIVIFLLFFFDNAYTKVAPSPSDNLPPILPIGRSSPLRTKERAR